jgi:hypothetical protein
MLFSFILYVSVNDTVAQDTLRLKNDSIVYIYHTTKPFLPIEFQTDALENVYYGEADSTYLPKGHCFTVKLRKDSIFFYETYFKPYKMTRIDFGYGKYTVSNDTIYFTYETLIIPKKKKGFGYVNPTTAVSWITPTRPKYLLIGENELCEPNEKRLNKIVCYRLNNELQFDFESLK